VKIDKNKKIIGKKQTQRALLKNEADSVYIAKDADKRVVNEIINCSQEKDISIIYVETMDKLGKMFGIDVKAAVAATLK